MLPLYSLVTSPAKICGINIRCAHVSHAKICLFSSERGTEEASLFLNGSELQIDIESDKLFSVKKLSKAFNDSIPAEIEDPLRSRKLTNTVVVSTLKFLDREISFGEVYIN